jgi:hypothetical protein
MNVAALLGMFGRRRKGHRVDRAAFRITGLAIISAFTACAASIAGTVTAADGTPVDAALTLHDISTVRTVGAQVFDHQFASRRDGAFSLSGIPAATYEICVDAPHLQVLDPCRWGGSAAKIKLAAGSAVTGFHLTVHRGFLLRVKVNDPGRVLPAPVGGIAGSALRMAVQTPLGRYENLRLQGVDATGRNHYLVIPYDSPLLLTAVVGTGLGLSNANGESYANGSAQIPILVLAGGSYPVVTFNVVKP